ncbi:MAG: hypothetical protein HXY20_13120 [Acidobacteria bacterium]|nr:hypothetical protein [Acidobacteriota bacterium]
MTNRPSRRQFMERSLLVSGGLTAGLAFEHRPLLAYLRNETRTPQAGLPAGGPLQMGKIGNLSVSRLICGGNLFSGFAHSGDLLYVSSLLKHYFAPEKILDTLELCEKGGINTAILRTDDHMVGILKRYRKERGGRIQWIAQTYPKVDNLRENIRIAIDNGAVGAYIMGGIGDTFLKEGRTELIGEVVSFIKRNGLVAGIGSHSLDVPKASEKLGFEPDFYVKTLNSVGYESQDPAEIAAFMKTVQKPWIAFKVLGAGRMKPGEGLDLAFRTGADFVNVGMYDFQVGEDISLVREIVAAHARRERPWRA